jgi:hypothetical protein
VSASDATKSKLLVLVDVLIKNEIVLKLLDLDFQFWWKSKERASKRKSI